MTENDQDKSSDEVDYEHILNRERYKIDKGRKITDTIAIRIKKLRRANKVMYRRSVY